MTKSTHIRNISHTITKGRIVLYSREILLFLCDASVFAFKPFDRHGFYRKNINDYLTWRKIDKNNFQRKLRYLKDRGFIRVYLDKKEKYIELMPKGKKELIKLQLKNMTLPRPKEWDVKWRMVVFDIPKEKNRARDFFRNQLKKLGFIQFQESILIYPFDCFQNIQYLVSLLQIEHCVNYLVVDFFQGDDKIIKQFLNSGILKEKMLK